MLNYVIAFTLIASVALGLTCIHAPKQANYIDFATVIGRLIVLSITWFAGRASPGKFGLKIAVGVLVIYLMNGVCFAFIDAHFYGEMARISGIFMFSLILAPSMRYMLYYLLVFYAYQAQSIQRHFESEERAFYLVNSLLFGLFMFFFWFIFQKRELKRFH